MASLFSHPAFPVALVVAGVRKIPKKLFWLGIMLTILPDIDVLAFRFGIAYESQWGHRGFTHSLSFAIFIGLICSLFSRQLESSRKLIFWWCCLSTFSHSLFDALTNGGLGVAWLWPLSAERFFFPIRPVQVSPIGVSGFLTWRGIVVLLSEIIWIWIPCFSVSLLLRYKRTRKTPP